MVILLVLMPGCLGGPASTIDGEWTGPITWSTETNSGTQPLVFHMILNKGRFVSWLESAGQPMPKKEGRFRVASQLGARWEIQLAADDSAEVVTLVITMGEAGKVMTVRQLDGDYRIAEWEMVRS